jgi:hypothetical protein
MSVVPPNLSACQENALSALLEIRACHEQLRTFLDETFDRLDEVVGRLRRHEGLPAQTERRADPDAMQEQIDHLTRLVTDLACTVKKRERTSVEEDGAQSSEAEP